MAKEVEFDSVLTDIFDKLYQLQDTQEIFQWASKNVYLPSGRGYSETGFFDVTKSPWLMEPFKALKDNNIRTVCIYKAVQTGGTLLFDIWLPYIIANTPGPIQYSMATDDLVKQHVNNRLYPLMRSCKLIKNLLPPNDRDYTNFGIQLPHMTIYCNGEKLSAFQAKSIQYVIADEVHMWDRGSLDLAISRSSVFAKKGTSKVLVISQPGEEGDDMHQLFIRGTQEHWSVPCKGCGKYFYPKWREQKNDGSYFGVLWDSNEITKPNGIYDVNKVLPTVRYECEFCGHKHQYSKELLEWWNDNGKYIQYNNNPEPSMRTFRWNAISILPWTVLVPNFLAAQLLHEQGIHENIISFWQQRVCKEKTPFMKDYDKVWIKTDVYDVQSDWPDSVARFLTIDVQKMHFWTEIREWAGDGRSRQLFFGKMPTVNEIKNLQEKFKVPDNCIFVDCAWTDADEETNIQHVYQMIDEMQWTGLRGANQVNMDGFDVLVKGQKVKRYFSNPKPVPPPHTKNRRWYFEFSNTPISNLLKALRDGKAQSFMSLDNPVYKEHMYGEKQEYIKNKYGQTTMRWVRKASKENHGWDCSKLQVVAALIHPRISLLRAEGLMDSVNKQSSVNQIQ